MVVAKLVRVEPQMAVKLTGSKSASRRNDTAIEAGFTLAFGAD
jgi:hypothetical protein